MPKIRRIDFYPDDWLAGTVGLSDVECGIYIRACALIYATGGPVKIELLRRACTSHGNAFNHVIAKLETLGKLLRNGNEIDSKRCRNELERVRKRLEHDAELKAKKHETNDLETQRAHARVTSRSTGQPTVNSQQSESEEESVCVSSPPFPPQEDTHTSAHIDEWSPTQSHFEQADALGRERSWLVLQAERYRDHPMAQKYEDHDAGFRNWIRDAAKFERRSYANGQQYSPGQKLWQGAAEAGELYSEWERQTVGSNSRRPAFPLLDRRH